MLSHESDFPYGDAALDYNRDLNQLSVDLAHCLDPQPAIARRCP